MNELTKISSDIAKIRENVARIGANQASTKDLVEIFIKTSGKNQTDLSAIKVHLRYLTIFFSILLTGVVTFFYTNVAKS